jgi:hypothetical protein
MTDYAHQESRLALPLSDLYLVLLSGVLLGYALMGKGFAYLGFPPLFIGEIAFLAGVAILLRTGCLVAALTTLPSLVLITTMAWVLLRTLPFVGAYGFDALRDSVIIMYGGFAFIVIALLLEDGRRIKTIIRYYGTFLMTFPAIPLAFGLTRFLWDYIPKLAGPNIPIVEVGASAVGTHLCGAAVFVLIGFRKVTWVWIVLLSATLVMIAATNRGATMAAVVPFVFAAFMVGKARLVFTAAVAGLALLAVAYAVETTFTPYEEAKTSSERAISAQQIVENLKSITGQSGQQTEGTKKWRLNWWEVIINDTLHGPSFWTGRGFGLNLADADGFGGTGDPRDPHPPLRSPHNAHMTLLARAGVPGVVLWALVLVSWYGMLVKAMLTARFRGHEDWTKLFLFVTCYVTSIIINATFDVTLEGPMQGIWFWCLFGFGIGAVMVYRAQPVDRSIGGQWQAC